MTGIRISSLKTEVAQSIPADGDYHVVRFPYMTESYDPWGMHNPIQPDGYGVASWSKDDRSGLIWPTCSGWGTLTSLIYWEAGDYDELRDRYVRDPLRLTEDGYDSTATEHRPPSPGMQCFHKSHQMFVRPDVPIALLVAHDASSARRVTLAEFKLSIDTSVEEP
ncbi:hypothetical protein ACFYQQ_01280 [Streptomyces sp. NPDC005496]|uniref:hypothetical protein n=1 Tax=unclassified Streptomyces TaxID=2593676 RepID=UPI0033B13E85